MSSLSKNNKTMKADKTVYQDAITIALAAALLLLLPLLAMQLGDEVTWTPFDFAAAWILLFSAGFTYKLITRKTGSFVYKAASGIAAGTALFLVWSNLAVGLIGSENNPANLMYLGVLAVAVIGTLIANFQPYGMALTFFVTALAQGLVAIIALISGMHHSTGSSVTGILGVNGFFIALWVGSALLYRYAALVQQSMNTASER